jgi:hypothetical protein
VVAGCGVRWIDDAGEGGAWVRSPSALNLQRQGITVQSKGEIAGIHRFSDQEIALKVFGIRGLMRCNLTGGAIR